MTVKVRLLEGGTYHDSDCSDVRLLLQELLDQRLQILTLLSSGERRVSGGLAYSSRVIIHGIKVVASEQLDDGSSDWVIHATT